MEMAVRRVISWRGLCAVLLITALAGLTPVAVQAAPDVTISGQIFGIARDGGSAETAAAIQISASVTDSDGNTYAAGTFVPGVLAILSVGEKADGTPVTIQSPSNAGLGFVAKFDKDGKVVWANSFNNTATSSGTPNYTISAIAIDSASNVYVAAQLTGVAAFILPSTSLVRAGSTDSFLMKIPAAGGSPSVVQKYGAANFAVKVTSVAVDSANNVFIGGNINGTTTGTYASNIQFSGDPSVHDGFIAKVDSTLAVPNTFASITYSGATAPTNVDIQSMVADSDGYIYTVGQFAGDDIFTPFVMNRSGTGSTDMFALRHHGGTMTEQWNKQYGGGAGATLLPAMIAVDASNIYISGGMTTSATIGALPAMTLLGNSDGLVLKANKLTGVAAWAKNFGGAGATTNSVSALGVDASGELRVGALFVSGDLTQPPLARVGSGVTRSVAILGLSSSGSFTVAKASGAAVGINVQPSRGISTDGMFVVAGSTNDDLSTPPLTKGSLNTRAALILRAAPPTYTVAVSKTGTGGGTVTSSAGGISCGATCTSTGLADNTAVALTATADAGSTFTSWGGDCSGTSSPFNLTLAAANATCTATFTLSNGPTPPTPSNPSTPTPPPSFVTNPPSTNENVSTIGSGSGSMSFASSFANPSGLTFTAAPVGGGSLPSWITFEPSSATFSYNVPLPPDLPIQPLAADSRAARADARANWPNTVYPLLLRVAQVPVVLTATDKATGVSYSSTIQMSFHAPRNPVAISAVSMSLDRVYGDRAAARSALSYDGGQMIFETAATNLFPAASSPYGDIVRYHGLSGARDRLTQTAIPGGGVANAANGLSTSPAVSANGAYAAFASDAAGVSVIPAGGKRQVYRTALGYPRVALNQAVTPAAEMVSATPAGVAGNGRSDNPSMSQDGRFVAFDSDATNLGWVTEGTRNVWRKDLATGEVVQVAAGTSPSISWDGRYVAFEAGGQVQVKDLTAGTVKAIGAGSAARLSARGDRVAFVSGTQVVQVDVVTGTRRLVGTGEQPAMSADGRFVAFRSVGTAGNGFSQIWLRDVDRGVTALVTQTASGAGGNGDSLYPSLSGDGAQVGFVSTATDLVNGTPTGTQAYLAANPLPLPEKTGYWYLAASNGGQGWLMERWGSQAYVGGLVYDAAGRASWVSGFCQLTGLTCSGSLSVRTGGTPFGAASGSSPVAGQAVGVTLTTSEDGRSTVLQVGNAAAQTLSVFPIAGAATTGFAGLPQAGWWMETGSTGGNGYFVAVDTQPQSDGSVRQMAYVSVLTFDTAGLPVWYSSQAALGSDLAFSGTLMQYLGGAQLGQVQVGASGASPMGQLRIAFTGNDTAQINLPNGRTANLSRFRF